MFAKKVVTRIELSDETKQRLSALDTDMQVLQDLMTEVIENQQKVLVALSGEIIGMVPVENETDLPDNAANPPDTATVAATVADESGVQPFAGNETLTHTTGGFRRSSPFSRRPRHEQVAWLLEIFADGRWHSPLLIAKSTAGDPSELRYLKRSIQARCREMNEDGTLDRRASKVTGAMFDYKLKKP